MEYTIYDIDELITHISLEYPDEITPQTDDKRNKNITYLKEFILEDVKNNNLKYEEKERRVLLYTTSLKEKIYIQYPGKYSKPSPKDGKVPQPVQCLNVIKCSFLCNWLP